MADAPRITVEELKKHLDAGEDFTVIDVRNPNAWAETDTGYRKRSECRWTSWKKTCPEFQRRGPSNLLHVTKRGV
jgi:hypothetical protein